MEAYLYLHMPELLYKTIHYKTVQIADGLKVDPKSFVSPKKIVLII